MLAGLFAISIGVALAVYCFLCLYLADRTFISLLCECESGRYIHAASGSLLKVFGHILCVLFHISHQVL